MIFRVFMPVSEGGLPADEITIPDMLKTANYTSTLVRMGVADPGLIPKPSSVVSWNESSITHMLLQYSFVHSPPECTVHTASSCVMRTGNGASSSILARGSHLHFVGFTNIPPSPFRSVNGIWDTWTPSPHSEGLMTSWGCLTPRTRAVLRTPVTSGRNCGVCILYHSQWRRPRQSSSMPAWAFDPQ